MTLRRLLAPLFALALAGCGGGRPDDAGQSSLWITRDRGDKVLLTTTVEAGQTALQALQRKADVETRYGGRFVQSINGVAGDLSAQRDWFYFVNGIEADRGAHEYRLRPGDVEWWDFRRWARVQEHPVVVGAFPEPFLHGYDGRTRPAAVRYESPRLQAGAQAIGRLIRAQSVAETSVPARRDANLFVLTGGPPRFSASFRAPGGTAGDPVRFVFAGNALRLARNPRLARFRYEGVR